MKFSPRREKIGAISARHAFRVIDGLTDDLLILDSDFIINDKTRFLTEEGRDPRFRLSVA